MATDRELLAGYILAGGRSRRFGADKADADWDGRTFATAVADTLRAAGCVDITLVASTPRALPDGVNRLIIDAPAEQRHPLNGLRAIVGDLRGRPTARALVMAVDQPFVRPEWLAQLLACDAGDVCVFGDAYPQPFPMGIPQAAMGVADKWLTKTSLGSMRAFLASIGARQLPLPGGWPSIGSINSPGEKDQTRGR